MTIKVIPLGAGQDVGRSCVIVEVGGRRLMFDCGIHMVNEQKFPDFGFLQGSHQQPLDFTKHIDCVLITHFHLDHCGALPYFTEGIGYHGPIIASPPTKAILPLMLEDFRKVSIFKQQDQNCFTIDMIKTCIGKIQTIQLYETLTIKDDIKVTCYYAGHVLGACRFYVECNGESVVYTGDYNMTADRHLGAAWIDKLRPDLCITETTYATTIRDSKRSREREFLKCVHETLDQGGKVLIPVFALGRAQELCILLETYWNRTNLKYPIYFSGGLTEKANFYYRLFINWTNEKIKKTFIKKNMFNFQHVKSLETASLKSEQPMVCFASPGMLHGGFSLQIFKEWANNEKNAIIIPGYCMPGTVGNKVLSGEKKINIDDRDIDVRIRVFNMSFSAHADSKGIMEMLTYLEPKNVMLVHGEKEKMRVLSQQIKDQLKVNCYFPANHTVTKIPTEPKIQIAISSEIINRMNMIYGQDTMMYYRANSQMHLSNCLLKITEGKNGSNDLIEIVQDKKIDHSNLSQDWMQIDDKQAPEIKDQESDSYERIDMQLTWISGQLKQGFLEKLREKLIKAVLEEKKLAFGVEFLIFDEEERSKAIELVDIIMATHIKLLDNGEQLQVKFGSLEEDVGEWLVDIIQQLNQ